MLHFYLVYKFQKISKEITKEKAIGAVNNLPDEFDVEQLIEKMIFIQQVEEGLEQSKKRQVVSFEDAKNSMKKWL